MIDIAAGTATASADCAACTASDPPATPTPCAQRQRTSPVAPSTNAIASAPSTTTPAAKRQELRDSAHAERGRRPRRLELAARRRPRAARRACPTNSCPAAHATAVARSGGRTLARRSPLVPSSSTTPERPAATASRRRAVVGEIVRAPADGEEGRVERRGAPDGDAPVVAGGEDAPVVVGEGDGADAPGVARRRLARSRPPEAPQVDEAARVRRRHPRVIAAAGEGGIGVWPALELAAASPRRR